MNILQVIPSVNPAGGGPVETLVQGAKIMADSGHNTEVATVDDPQASWVKDFPYRLYPLGPGTLTYGYSNRFVPWVINNGKNYDCIIVHGIWQYHSYGVWKACRASGKPYYLFTHGMLDPWFKEHYPLKHLKKMVYWHFAESRVLKDAKAVLFTCEEELLLARRSFRSYSCNEKAVSYGTSAPPGDKETLKKKFFADYPELHGKKILLFLGRIHPKKGCDLLIDAFSLVFQNEPSVQLVIAGPDQVGWKKELATRARQLGVENRITWTGLLTGDLKWGAYYASEVFVLPSHQENFGIVVAEAMACGLPVLISNKVNIWREIKQDDAGLIESDDLDGTIALLQRWLTIPGWKKLIMGRNAVDSFHRRFEIHKAIESLLESIE
ncbi:MAG: transferase [Candidatus Margulisiibacteriota bacterium]|nr:MAG: transferase [Candidatus Margulisbacteria bacterium GWD2_39_127]PZM79495.1 MAG: transferase [Candidatus Margulisiibacteriota bacterium]HAR63834.1 transferase [Candidatus Margulisiibacteriota bacterium]HCY37832.1 transferase [Candidatus Margulisiibacteriota bacterium]